MKREANAAQIDALLAATGHRPIVEVSTRDPWWGARLVAHRYEGENVLGRLWMELRRQLRDDDPASRSGAWVDRTLGVLSKMFNLAEMWGLRPDGSNPCLHVKRFKEEKRERFLSAEEFRRLGKVLNEILEDGSETLSAVAAIRLLMLTGCRLSEIQKLRWEHVHLDARELRPRDSKTGAKVVHVGDPAIAVLREIDRQDNSPWVIAGRKPGEPSDRPSAPLAEHPGARRARRCAHPQFAPQLRQHGSPAWLSSMARPS